MEKKEGGRERERLGKGGTEREEREASRKREKGKSR